MINLSEDLKQAIMAHALAESPRECCGVLVDVDGELEYVGCRNMADHPLQQFAIHHQDYAKAEERGEIVAIVHSHPFASVEPSEADRTACEASGMPWIIVNPQTEAMHQFAPEGHEAPLIGRTFVYGVHDCYSVIRDHYKRELGIALPDVDREEFGWWKNGKNLYVEQFERVGFVDVHDAPRKHDCFLMQVQSNVSNHAAVYLGDNLILHHLVNQLSRRDIYGGYWMQHTSHVLRYRTLC